MRRLPAAPLAAVCLALAALPQEVWALVRGDGFLQVGRRARQVPFIVSFRVRISGGDDNEELAESLARGINEANTSAAALFAYSTARLVPNG
eukprot:CAMPEP_0176268498 /NCGR_PEP_ID=MMETSP0121_2-20121125/43705_1 /TAXON_ID=160619 /ORGANISM="Kryptoperidinium foliaceum, Strain CCMP 1326" /LENGTH=91 /DNA_ID=CAMNT_0017608593 /DNA_START=79 /DNA_END=351 /DNA_ORIENTATION=+